MKHMSDIEIIQDDTHGQVVVQKTPIIGTNRVVLSVWKPVSGPCGDASSITPFEEFPGKWFGRIGTFRCPGIDHLPVGEERTNRVNDHYFYQSLEAYDLIDKSSFIHQCTECRRIDKGEVIYETT